MQQKICENQNIIAERQEAKIKQVLSDGYKFKERAIDEQHKHNVKVISKLKEASDELNEDKVAEAKQKIAEGSDIVKQRQKLIRLADLLKGGIYANTTYFIAFNRLKTCSINVALWLTHLLEYGSLQHPV